MRHQPVRRAFGFDFFGGFAKGQRLGLRKNIRQQNVVVPPSGVSAWPNAMKSHGISRVP
jgi:hypothetical protein